MELLAKVPYWHPDDRDVSYVLYDRPDNREGATEEFIVWTETSTGDRYWGHYFPYTGDEQKEAMRKRAFKCFLYLASRRYGLHIDEEEAFI